MIRLAAILAAACCLGCTSVPEKFTVVTPKHIPLATIDLKRGNVILTPQGMILLNAWRHR